MQIFGAPWLTENGTKTICPHNLSDNGGCDGGPRTVTARTSKDGVHFSGDLGCANPKPSDPVDPSVRKKCETFDETKLIRPHPTEDPPEMQFCKNLISPLSQSNFRSMFLVSVYISSRMYYSHNALLYATSILYRSDSTVLRR